MPSAESFTPLIFICGPTCSGKSALALHLFHRWGGNILNGDSVQIFKSVNIGTAKPTKSEFSQAPHHLYDLVEEGDAFTAGQYHEHAVNLISELNGQRPKAPTYVVGGSGFYFKALEFGMFDVGEVSSQVSEQIEQMHLELGDEGLYNKLAEMDPVHAPKIYPQDLYRIKRALGLMLSQRKTMTEIHAEFNLLKEQQRIPNPILKIALKVDRDPLREDVRRRCEQMVEQGLVDEVQALRAKGLENWAPMKSIGYKEVQDMLDGHLDPNLLVDEMVKNTMRLAKRQMTWFKKEPDFNWFNALEQKEQSWQGVENLVNQFLDNWAVGE